MKKTKISILLWLLLFPFVSLASSIINPVYTSDRFQPSDQFHAGCDNQIDLVFYIEDTKINGLNAILEYNPSEIEVLSVVWENEKENNLSYVVNDDKIILSKLKTEWQWSEWLVYDDSIKFSITIKAKEWTTSTTLSFADWSYMLDAYGEMISISEIQHLTFAEVAECEPDIVAPKISLLFPSNKAWNYVALDTYYQFDISDTGKWINTDSIIIEIDGVEYNINQIEHEWNWSVLTVYPDSWAPLDSKFRVKISASDRQVYWWPNTTTEVFGFRTSDQIYLLNDIDPIEYRKLVNSQKYYQWSSSECNLLAYQYALAKNEWNLDNQKLYSSINNKLNCNNLSDETMWVFVLDDLDSFSIFSIVWWSLFWLLLLIVIFRYCSK